MAEINNTAIVKSVSPFDCSNCNFTDIQRKAKALSYSSLVPDDFSSFRNPNSAISNCLVAMDIASSFGEKVTTIARSLYVIHGKPAFSTPFLIGQLIRSKQFSPLKYIFRTDAKGNKIACHCEATELASGEVVDGPEVTLEMAKAEKWGSKWDTMPELMLRYRAAAFFIRLRAPDVMMGFYTTEEQEDIDATQGRAPTIATFSESKEAVNDLNNLVSKKSPKAENKPVDAEVEEDLPQQKPQNPDQRKQESKESDDFEKAAEGFFVFSETKTEASV